VPTGVPFFDGAITFDISNSRLYGYHAGWHNLTGSGGGTTTVPNGGTGQDLSGSLSGAIPFYNTTSGLFDTAQLAAYTNVLSYTLSSGLLNVYRTNRNSASLLALTDGTGSAPIVTFYGDKQVSANTNYSVESGASYSVRLRVGSGTNIVEATAGGVTASHYPPRLADDAFTGASVTGYANSGGVTQWDAVYMNGSSQWVKADANGSGTYPARGLAVATALTTVATTVLEDGIFRDDGGTAWTPGGTIYLSTTAGGLTQTPPATTGDKIQVIGYALEAHVVRVKIGTDYGTAP